MYIVFIAPSIKTGGGNRVFIELANHLSEYNDVSIVYPYNSDEMHTFTVNSKVNFLKIGNLAISKFAKVVNLIKCIRYLNKLDARYKLIISDPIFCLLTPLIKRKKNLYRFVQSDDYRIYDDGFLLGKGLFYMLYKGLTLNSYRAPINFIFNSRYVFENYCKDAKRSDVPCNLVHPAIDHNVFYHLSRSVNSSQQVSICLIGRKHPLKGLKTFLNVYHDLSNDEKRMIKKIVIISHDDMSAFDVRDIDILRPSSDKEIADVYRTSDIFISTSWQEGFGLPPLEAMASGCAVICSKAGGVNEFAIDNVNCLMFEPRDEKGLRNLLLKLVGDETLRNQLRLNGIASAEAFSWEKSAKALEEILN